MLKGQWPDIAHWFFCRFAVLISAMINETLLKSTFRLQKQQDALHERGLQLLPRRQPQVVFRSRTRSPSSSRCARGCVFLSRLWIKLWNSQFDPPSTQEDAVQASSASAWAACSWAKIVKLKFDPKSSHIAGPVSQTEVGTVMLQPP